MKCTKRRRWLRRRRRQWTVRARIESKWITMHILTINHFGIQTSNATILLSLHISLHTIYKPRTNFFFAISFFILFVSAQRFIAMSVCTGYLNMQQRPVGIVVCIKDDATMSTDTLQMDDASSLKPFVGCAINCYLYNNLRIHNTINYLFWLLNLFFSELCVSE